MLSPLTKTTVPSRGKSVSYQVGPGGARRFKSQRAQCFGTSEPLAGQDDLKHTRIRPQQAGLPGERSSAERHGVCQFSGEPSESGVPQEIDAFPKTADEHCWVATGDM